MNLEIEAKLRAPDAGTLDRIAALERLEGWVLEARRTQRLESVYLDGAGGELGRARIGARIRRRGRAVEATVKREGTVRSGVHRRPEWTVPLDAPPRFPWRLPGALRSRLPRNLRDVELRPILHTSIRRRVRQVRIGRSGNVLAELALDEVSYRAPGNRVLGRMEFEIEVELVDGEARDLAAIVRGLRSVAPLPASRGSKLERGLRRIAEPESTRAS